MVNEWTGGETPPLDGIPYIGPTLEDWLDVLSEEGSYLPVDYPTLPFDECDKTAWQDCLYCGGSPGIPCQYNHVEARPKGDAKKRDRSREQYVTTVESCKENVPVFLSPKQRFTSKPLHRGEYLRKGV